MPGTGLKPIPWLIVCDGDAVEMTVAVQQPVDCWLWRIAIDRAAGTATICCDDHPPVVMDVRALFDVADTARGATPANGCSKPPEGSHPCPA